MKYVYAQYSVNEVDYFLKFLTDNLPKYKLSELTFGMCADLPSISGAHPLSVEYGNAMNVGENGEFTSILPAIGVELMDDVEPAQQLLGAGQRSFEVTDDYLSSIESLTLRSRFRNGVLMADSVLKGLQAAKLDKGGEALWGKMDKFLQQQTVAISIWSNHIDVTRNVYLVLRNILKEAKRDLSSQGVKNVNVTGQVALYNFDFGYTLFGAEFNISLLNVHDNISVDSDIGTIKHVDESAIPVDGTDQNKFKPLKA